MSNKVPNHEDTNAKAQHPMMWLFNRRVWRTSYNPDTKRKGELELARQEENLRRMEAAEAKRARKAARKGGL